MTSDLWALYLRLQTDMAYGVQADFSPVDTEQTGIACQYLQRICQIRILERGLVLGPGGPTEIRTLQPFFTALSVLTAHHPEAVLVQQHFPLCDAREGDIHNMPFASGTVDFIFASNVLEHCFAPYIALLECRRLLREGGLAYFILPTFEGPEGGQGPFHLHCLTVPVWVELLRKTGFVAVDVLSEPGTQPGGGGYWHFQCAATTLPHPHDRLLQELITFKASRG